MVWIDFKLVGLNLELPTTPSDGFCWTETPMTSVVLKKATFLGCLVAQNQDSGVNDVSMLSSVVWQSSSLFSSLFWVLHLEEWSGEFSSPAAIYLPYFFSSALYELQETVLRNDFWLYQGLIANLFPQFQLSSVEFSFLASSEHDFRFLDIFFLSLFALESWFLGHEAVHYDTLLLFSRTLFP